MARAPLKNKLSTQASGPATLAGTAEVPTALISQIAASTQARS